MRQPRAADEAETPAPLPRGAGALPPEVVLASQRRRLVEAAGHVVAQKGYVATTISDIVARARVSRSAFYACFPDKEACFLAAYQEQAERHFELTAAAVAGPDWLTQLQRAVHAYVHELERRPAFARSFLIEILAAGPRAVELRHEVHERYSNLIKGWYERAPSELKLPALPAEIFRAAVGATNELVIARLEGRRSERDRMGGDTPALEGLVLHSLLALFGLGESSVWRPARR